MPMTVVNYVKTPQAKGKFILLRKPDDEQRGILVFSDFTLDSQHYDILSRWQRTNNTTLADSGLSVRGGGWWRVEDSKLILYGQSAAFGRFDSVWVRDRMRPGMFMTETGVDVL